MVVGFWCDSEALLVSNASLTKRMDYEEKGERAYDCRYN
jgi:hypothetical protein